MPLSLLLHLSIDLAAVATAVVATAAAVVAVAAAVHNDCF